MTGRQLNNIQALRGIAAFLVIFAHLESVGGTLHLASTGYGGVDLFFIISGFIMVYMTRGRNIRPWTFLRNRICRIVPLYWTISLLVFVVAIVTPSLLHHTSASILDLLQSLFFVPFRKGGLLDHPVLFVGWTLNYEMFFYALFSVGLAFPRYRQGLCFTIGSLIVLASLSLMGPFKWIYPSFFLSEILAEFGIGMLIASFYERVADRLDTSVAIPVLITTTLGGLLLTIVLPVVWPSQHRALVMGIPAAVTVFSALVLERKGRYVKSKALILIGDVSYSLYLVHPFATQAVQTVYKHLPQTEPVAAISLVAAYALAIGFALMTYRLIEKPGSMLLRQLLMPQENCVVESRTPA